MLAFPHDLGTNIEMLSCPDALDCILQLPIEPHSIFQKIYDIMKIRADSRFAPSQWETPLLCNDVSNWLGASLESVLKMYIRLLFWTSCRNVRSIEHLYIYIWYYEILYMYIVYKYKLIEHLCIWYAQYEYWMENNFEIWSQVQEIVTKIYISFVTYWQLST